jgi:Raf kinase inhibitor-like YbhB/YbcL family protein
MTACHVAAQDKDTEPQLTLMIPAFADGSNLPAKYSCKNAPAGVSPQIKWINVPAGTQSFAIMLHDPDRRPRGGVYDILHWLIWNIPGTARELPEGIPTRVDLPDGSRQLKRVNHAFYPVGPGEGAPGTPGFAPPATSGNVPAAGYLGPCGPPGGPNHHYTFELYALDTKLDLDANAGRADVMKAMDGHILQSAVYIALFRR